MSPLSGYGGITVVMEGPHRSELDYEELEPRKYKVMYSPHEPGIYILNIRFADEHVNGKTKDYTLPKCPNFRLNLVLYSRKT